MSGRRESSSTPTDLGDSDSSNLDIYHGRRQSHSSAPRYHAQAHPFAHGFTTSMRSLMTNTSLAQEEMPLPEANGREYAGSTSMRSLALEIIDAGEAAVKPRRSRRRRHEEADQKPAHKANDNNHELTRNTDVGTSADDEESFYAYALSRSMRSLDPSLAEDEVRSLNEPGPS